MFSNRIVHHPAVINIGPLPIAGFGIAVLLAFLIAQIVSEHELSRRGHEIEAKAVSDVLFAAVVGTMLGGKLYYVLVAAGAIGAGSGRDSHRADDRHDHRRCRHSRRQARSCGVKTQGEVDQPER